METQCTAAVRADTVKLVKTDGVLPPHAVEPAVRDGHGASR